MIKLKRRIIETPKKLMLKQPLEAVKRIANVKLGWKFGIKNMEYMNDLELEDAVNKYLKENKNELP